MTAENDERQDAQDTHYEVILDDPEPDEPPAQREPVHIDVVVKEHERTPIIPAALRKGNRGPAARYHGSLIWYRLRKHGWLLWWRYLPLAVLYAPIGAAKLAGRVIRWWMHPELSTLLQEAARANDTKIGPAIEKQLAARRTNRGIVLLVGLVTALVGLTVFVLLAPGWMVLLAALATVPALAHVGRPMTRPIVEAAIVTKGPRRINTDIVALAYYRAGIGRADKGPDQRVTFAGNMAREGQGSQVMVYLPPGVTFAEVMKVRAKIASALDIAVSQIFLTPVKASESRHILWIADRDPLAIPAGRAALLDCRPRDIWQPAPFGLDERGRKVMILLLWNCFLIGAQPRKGKTFAARLLALFAALDPYVVMIVVDGKCSPDWLKFRLIAHRFIYGTHPNPVSSDPIAQFLDALAEIKQHIRDVNTFLSTLPTSECPEGKLTREISRKYPQARVWMLVVEEFQVYFETEDQDINKQIANDLAYIQAVGPSAGVILVDCSQKPSGVGAGDVARLFNRFRDNHTVRFALKCGNRIVSEAVLGGDAYAEGYDASSLPVGDEYRGVGYLYGLTDDTPTVRTYLADHPDAEKILTAARRHREAAGTLTGEAAGEEMSRMARDVLRDTEAVFRAGEAWVSWDALAARLAEEMPEAYAGTTKEAIGAQVRAFGPPSKDGWENGRTLKGLRREHLAAAIKRREIEAKR